MNRAPAFQFFPKDWLDFKVQRMSLAAQGAYIKLLCFLWTDSKNQCSILDEDNQLARAIGITVEHWLELRKEIQQDSEPIFEVKNGLLVSARLRYEAAKQRKYRKLQSEKGKRSAQQRLNHSSTAVGPEYQPTRNSSPPSSSLSSKRKNKTLPSELHSETNGHPPGFQIFWTAYPRKQGKGACENWWNKHQPDDVQLGIMLHKVEEAKKTPQWQEDRGKYIPMPSTWLNQKRWEDDYRGLPALRHERLPL